MIKNKKIIIFVHFLLFSVIFTKSAAAYLDPGTGSYIFQLLIAAFFGILFAIKMFWIKIKLFFNSLFAKFKNK